MLYYSKSNTHIKLLEGALRTVYDEKKRCLKIQARYEDFDGSHEKWMSSFYEIWKYQLTWNFAWKIELLERVDGVLVSMNVKPEFADNVKAMMESLGYRNMEISKMYVGIINEVKHDELYDVDLIITE